MALNIGLLRHEIIHCTLLYLWDILKGGTYYGIRRDTLSTLLIEQSQSGIDLGKLLCHGRLILKLYEISFELAL